MLRLRFSRPNLAEVITWIVLVVLLGSTSLTHAATGRASGEEYASRNHGTGGRVGVACATVRSFEVAAFHQHALSPGFSVLAEAGYYRQHAAAITSGLHLPALLVFNLFDNGSIQVGPQLQWQLASRPARVAAPEALTSPVPAAPTSPVSVALVAGAELRVECVRFGMRFNLPFSALTNLPEAGDRMSAAWKTGQVQAYVGVGF